MTTTTAARAGRIAGHAWLALQWAHRTIDWAEVGRIVLHGLAVAAVLTFLAGQATGAGVHRINDWLSARWVALLVEQPAAPEPKPETPGLPLPPAKHPETGQLAPPAVAPLFDDLANLSTRQLMALAGTRSKKHRRADLLAMVAAC